MSCTYMETRMANEVHNYSAKKAAEIMASGNDG